MSATTTESADVLLDESPSIVAWRIYLFAFASGLALLALTELLWHLARTPAGTWQAQHGVRVGLLCLIVVIAGLYAGLKRNGFSGRVPMVNCASTLAFIAGVLFLVSRCTMASSTIPGLDSNLYWALGDLVVLHLLFSAMLPVRPFETASPFVPVWMFWALAMLGLAPEIPTFNRITLVIISPLAFSVGVALAAWRVARQHQAHERRALRGQVKSIGGELSRARIVHDAMFPNEFDLGHIAFDYQYQPIAEIGGDYVHMHVCPNTQRIYLTLLDVAGHGLAAALTVNRLFGELERIRAENPSAGPDDVMVLLNRYINLTMAPHSLFATGACIMIDPSTGELTWVNAGHPPAMVRTSSGDVRDLETTCVLLGVLSPEEFKPAQQSLILQPNDVVIAYTDGVIEARDPDGQQFGLKRLRETARFDPPPRWWSRFITDAVAKHHDGHPDDDLLVVALTLRSRTLRPVPRSTDGHRESFAGSSTSG